MLRPGRFLDPKSDIVFKKIFGENKDLLKSFLNSVLPLKDDELIDTLEYLSPEQTPRIPGLKNTIVDVKCRDLNGRIFIVEMQLQWSDHFANRLQFGACKAYVQQLDKGEDYQSLCPVYALGIINATFHKDPNQWYHVYGMVEKETQVELEGLHLVFIELPKFNPRCSWEKKLGILWLRFLKEIHEKSYEIDHEFEETPELMKALELSQEASYTMAELDAYDHYWDAVSTEKTFIKDAFYEGLKEGEKKGREEGREEGVLEGKRIIAKQLLSTGMALEQVLQITGLGAEELN